jgi:gliding motility-associated lipoprotein GldH
MTKILRKLINLFIAVVLLTSCTSDAVFFSYQSINGNGWNKDSVCTFDVQIEDAAIAYNVYVNTRNRGEYPYQNLWLFIRQTSPDSVVINDTIEFYLADEFGKWMGKGVGSAFNMPVLYKQNYKFKIKGVYRFEIQHGMRDSLLAGINDVGIKVEKAK